MLIKLRECLLPFGPEFFVFQFYAKSVEIDIYRITGREMFCMGVKLGLSY
jgi:hypothetical protein